MFSKGLSGAALGAAVAIGLGLSALPARAQYVVTLRQEGDDVIATGSGTLDLAGLTFSGSGETFVNGMIPFDGTIATGPMSGNAADVYTGVTGPKSFGRGGKTLPGSGGSGDYVGVEAFDNSLLAPAGYVSGTPLTDSTTYDSATFASLGVTPGVYKWTWATCLVCVSQPRVGGPVGAPDGSFTLNIAAAPEPSTWIMMLAGFAGLGLAAWRTSRKGAAFPA
jgi:hypothetical protein